MERLSMLIEQKVQSGVWKGVKASRGGPFISHLKNADDLLLLGKATETQLEVMMDSLQLFCDASGQKVNKAKSPIFLSPNVPTARARQLSSTCQIPLATDMGKYLGIKLVQGRVTRSSFADIVEKVNKKFTGWKAKSLCRATLVQSLTSAIPQYKMQTMALPAAVCSEVDKMNRKFLWGDRAEQKKGLPC
ncbi:hypothetical protein SLE2022_403900 [Rubroshorea leprosula]|uniref:Reverse transcriptase domain-containing protein n=1 Tax=Rubroshorea leprosula TaxID=152421 RepID=A0AAV5MWP3_9ROSI|nr:hypothetical protein SLEP1_g60547 [Rubroshorea leprosula]